MPTPMTTVAIPQGWTLRSWTILGSGPIPSGGFVEGGALLIGISANQSTACDLHWLDAASNQSFLRGLPFGNGEPQDRVQVSFGGVTVTCTVTLSLDAGVLTGELFTGSPGDGNTGTFVADANPPRGDGLPRQNRAEEHAST